MPIHDWSRVKDGSFHHFHQLWITTIARELNNGVLPPGYCALAEQRVVNAEPDVLAMKGPTSTKGGGRGGPHDPSDGSVGVLTQQPQVGLTMETDSDFYTRKQNYIAICDDDGDDELVAVIEIVSPGNKSNQRRFRQFINKAEALIFDHQIQLLVIDLHLLTPRDPDGIHGAIWRWDDTTPDVAPPGKPLTLVSYEVGDQVRAHIQPIAIGDTLIDMPLYLRPGGYVLVPLVSTYETAFSETPERYRSILSSGV